MQLFSPAQVAGYAAFILGVTAFVQKSDRRLKLFSASQGLVYCLHFLLLGNLPACSSSLISSVRTFLALRYRSWVLVVAFLALNLGFGAALVKSPAGWLPIAGSCLGTIAIFTLQGVALRSVLLASTSMWLVNNIISGSIGGTLLEMTIFTVNLSTMIGMVRSSKADAGGTPVGNRHRRRPSRPAATAKF